MGSQIATRESNSQTEVSMAKILVAEDSFALANLLGFVLKNAGLEVEIHNTGTAAAAACEKNRYDIILLDQQMPGMTGVEVAAHLRNRGPNGDTPLFLCTAKTHELDLEEIKSRFNVMEIFQKPFSPKFLVEQLRSSTQLVVSGWGAT
ncbi:MAG: response regulator [Planctomycetales bacterium]|nr:response regulator [Planctomycetales bacterium]